MIIPLHLETGPMPYDGTDICLDMAGRSVVVTLPSAETRAKWKRVWADHFAARDRQWRIALAMAVKTAEPHRSHASVAKALDLTPNVVARWTKKALDCGVR